jgi:hypothetical protein
MYGNLEMKEVDFICKTVNELTLWVKVTYWFLEGLIINYH